MYLCKLSVARSKLWCDFTLNNIYYYVALLYSEINLNEYNNEAVVV